MDFFSQVFAVSSNIILDASRGGNRRSKRHALDIAGQDFVLCSATIFLLLVMTKKLENADEFQGFMEI